ncbi:MAG: transcription factor S [Candidatus Methanomethylicia archaeon]
MEFCPKCKTLLIPRKSEEGTHLICKNCGYKMKASSLQYKIVKLKEKESKGSLSVVEDKNENLMPKTKVECPTCGGIEAYWWLVQTRRADEAPTRFYKCTKCGYTWREYD